MTSRSIALKLAFAVSTLSLSMGYALAGYWWIAAILLMMVIFWGLSKNGENYAAESVLLFAYIMIAAIGMSMNLSKVLMILACALALASWDLIRFERSVWEGIPCASLEKHHLQSLALAIFAGTLLALIALTINMQLPFWGVSVLVIMALAGLFYGVRFAAK